MKSLFFETESVNVLFTFTKPDNLGTGLPIFGEELALAGLY